MILTPEIAQSIIKETKHCVKHNINVMNNKGIIIASRSEDRIGQFHEGAWKALQTRKDVIISKEDKLRGLKQGVNLPIYFENHIIGVIGVTGPPSEVEDLGQIIKKMTEIMIKATYYGQQLDLENRARESFVDEWLAGDIEDDKIFTARGWILGINVHIPRVVAVIEIANMNEMFYKKLHIEHKDVRGEIEIQRLRTEIMKMIQSYLNVYDQGQTIVSLSSSQKYTLLKVIENEKSQKSIKKQILKHLKKISALIFEKYGFNIIAGIGRCDGMNISLSKSLREAEQAVLFAKTLNNEYPYIFFDDLGIQSFVNEIPKETREDFISRILDYCNFSKEEDLITTLRVFFKNDQSIAKTAEEMIVHKNTVQYRLKKVKDLTGHDPRIFTEAILLYVALVFCQFNEY